MIKGLESQGFKKTDGDTIYSYEKALMCDLEIEECGLEEDEVAKLLYGHSPLASGFCIYTGSCFVWINSQTASEAVDFANKIVSFEPIF